jgi:hypothetical protein
MLDNGFLLIIPIKDSGCIIIILEFVIVMRSDVEHGERAFDL